MRRSKKTMDKPIDERPRWQWRMKSSIAPEGTFVRIIRDTWKCTQDEAQEEFDRALKSGEIVAHGAIGTMRDVPIFKMN